MSRAKLAIASTANGALRARAAWEPRAKIARRGGRRLRGRACRLRGSRPRTSRVSHGDAHYTHERARAFFGCAVDKVCVGCRSLRPVAPWRLSPQRSLPCSMRGMRRALPLTRSRIRLRIFRCTPHCSRRRCFFGSRFLAIQESRVGAASPLWRSPESSPASSACFLCSRRGFSTQALRVGERPQR